MRVCLDIVSVNQGWFESHRSRNLPHFWWNSPRFCSFPSAVKTSRSSSWSSWHTTALQRAFEIINPASAKRRALSARRINNSLLGNTDRRGIFYASSLNFINVMQTRAFQHIKLLMLCEYTVGLQILINIICMLICIFLISDIIYAHNFCSMMPAHGHIN